MGLQKQAEGLFVLATKPRLPQQALGMTEDKIWLLTPKPAL